MAVVVGAYDNVFLRGAAACDNVAAVSAEFLRLNVEADLLELLSDVFGRLNCAGLAGLAAFARGVGEPGDMGAEAVGLDSGDGEACG